MGNVWAGLVVAVGASACTITEPPELETESSELVADQYYELVSLDFRRCNPPMCGGAYVKIANASRTLCADNLYASSCYVAGIDLSRLGLGAVDAVHFEDYWKAGWTLPRAHLRQGVYPEFPEIAVLSVGEAWRGAADSGSSATKYRLADNGTVCATEPCHDMDATKLNLVATTAIAELDLSAVAATSSEKITAMQLIASGGEVLVAGKIASVKRMGVTRTVLRASQFYLPFP